jgi:predicted HTH domain antitoxin
MGMNVLLEIPDRIAESFPESDNERQQNMRFALACGLFAMGEVDSGSAAEIAGIGRLEFLDAYGSHGMQRPYHIEDLNDDLAFSSNC